MEDTYQGATIDSLVEGRIIVERREQFTAYVNPLVQQPPTDDTSFQSLMEGHADSPVETEYGHNAPFWRTSMGQAIYEFEVTRPSFENPPPGENEYRRIQASLDRAHNFLERMERIVPSLVSYKEHLSSLFPRILDPWPFRYCSLAETLGPIEEVLFSVVISHNPGQTSNPRILNQRYMSSPPIPSVAGGESSTQMVSVHSNTEGKPLT